MSDLERCWATEDVEWQHYHDHVWSPPTPVTDERALFEMLALVNQVCFCQFNKKD